MKSAKQGKHPGIRLDIQQSYRFERKLNGKVNPKMIRGRLLSRR